MYVSIYVYISLYISAYMCAKYRTKNSKEDMKVLSNELIQENTKVIPH